MTQSALGRAAMVSLALGTATIGCTPDGRTSHVAALADGVTTADAHAAHDAAKAHAALDKRDAASAIRYAERAVAASPNNADYRMVLSRSYLAAGRFVSAETSLRETLALSPDQPRAAYDLALAQIALGATSEASATLAAVKGHVPDADLGLALALAGDRAQGVAVLTDLVRSGQSDGRGRQNLALVLALNGQWNEARGMAMQDTPPDRLEAKLAGWRTMAQQGVGAHQVATMLGIQPAIGDPGRPTTLALAAPTSTAPVALALAAPIVAAPAVPEAAVTTGPVRTVSLTLDPPVLAPKPPVQAAAIPAMLAATAPAERRQPARMVRVAATPSARAAVTPGPLLRAPAGSGFVVQLGAFSRPAALDAAWAKASRLSPRLAGFEAVRGETEHLGGTLVRLSIGGFTTRHDADAVCGEIRKHGGPCFVRGAFGDRPWQWAGKDSGTQIAMR